MAERRNGQHPNHPNPDPVERSEQIQRVWELKRQMWTFTEIAEEVGVSRSTAHKLFKEGLMMQAPPGAEEERILAVQHQEELIAEAKRALDRILDPVDKLKAILALDKLMKSRRELLGLDAPTKFQGNVTHQTQQDMEIQDLIRKIQSEDLKNVDRIHRREWEEGSRRGSRDS